MTLSLPNPLVSQRGWEDERTGVQRNLERIAEQFPVGPENLYTSATYTTLPTGPPQGFEADYVTGGVVWRFKYLPDLDATYPWHRVGGGHLLTKLQGSQVETLASAAFAYQDAIGGPTLAVPLAGRYLAKLNFTAIFNAAANLTIEGRVTDAASVALSDAARCSGGQFNGDRAQAFSVDEIVVSSPQTLKVRIAGGSTTAGVFTLVSRSIELLPIRVAG